jgi:hypothetical protein
VEPPGEAAPAPEAKDIEEPEPETPKTADAPKPGEVLDLDAEKAGGLPPFDKGAAKAALAAAASQASGCGSSAQLEGTRVSVTFAPSGRVTQALVTSGQAAGTAAGGCVARAFRSARIKPYAGGRVTLLKTVYPRRAR